MDPSRSYTGVHTFEVRARNEFGKVSLPDTARPRRDMRRFVTVYPAFSEGSQKRILLAFHNKQPQTILPWAPSNEQLIQYYREIYDSLGYSNQYDVWNALQLGMPSFSVMGRYTTIHVIDDIGPLSGTAMRALILGTMYGRYLDVGGYMILNGIPDFAPSRMVQNPESLVIKRMHMLGVGGNLTNCSFITNTQSDFIGAFGNTALGFPQHVDLDSSKLSQQVGNYPYVGGIPNLSVSYPRGFGEVIFSYDSKSDTEIILPQACGFSRIIFQGHSMGYLYRGINFKTAYYGFPLWFVKKDQAKAIIRRTYELFYP
jgi:hypothetical protein